MKNGQVVYKAVLSTTDRHAFRSAFQDAGLFCIAKIMVNFDDESKDNQEINVVKKDSISVSAFVEVFEESLNLGKLRDFGWVDKFTKIES